MKKLGLTLTAILFGCASYGPMNASGGFSHQMISESVYEVQFTGSAFNDLDEISDLAKLRAAEIGRDLGFEYVYFGSTENQSFQNKSTTYLLRRRRLQRDEWVTINLWSTRHI